MSDYWFFGTKDRGYGPFSQGQLVKLYGGGRLKDSDLVWRQGDKNCHPLVSYHKPDHGTRSKTSFLSELRSTSRNTLICALLSVATLAILLWLGFRVISNWSFVDGIVGLIFRLFQQVN